MFAKAFDELRTTLTETQVNLEGVGIQLSEDGRQLALSVLRTERLDQLTAHVEQVLGTRVTTEQRQQLACRVDLHDERTVYGSAGRPMSEKAVFRRLLAIADTAKDTLGCLTSAQRDRIRVSFECDTVSVAELLLLNQAVAPPSQDVGYEHIGRGLWLGFGRAESRYAACSVVHGGAAHVYGHREYTVRVSPLTVQSTGPLEIRVEGVSYHPAGDRRLLLLVDHSCGSSEYSLMEEHGVPWREVGRHRFRRDPILAGFLADGRIALVLADGRYAVVEALNDIEWGWLFESPPTAFFRPRALRASIAPGDGWFGVSHEILDAFPGEPKRLVVWKEDDTAPIEVADVPTGGFRWATSETLMIEETTSRSRMFIDVSGETPRVVAQCAPEAVPGALEIDCWVHRPTEAPGVLELYRNGVKEPVRGRFPQVAANWRTLRPDLVLVTPSGFGGQPEFALWVTSLV